MEATLTADDIIREARGNKEATMDDMSICVDCHHCTRMEYGSPRAHCDYNILCAAFDGDAVSARDPVLGTSGFLGEDGIIHSRIADARPTCRSKNPNGNCRRFSPITPTDHKAE
jgi:hypothetical protein